MRWILSSDHAGVELKKTLANTLELKGHEVIIKGPRDETERTDYPDAADEVVTDILEGKADYGILVCGTGIGVSMRANRYKGIRATLIHNIFTATAAKEHSNANILCFGERALKVDDAVKMLEAFLAADFEGGRHTRRLEKLDAGL